MNRTHLVPALIAGAAIAACTRAASDLPPPASARVITEPSELLWGPASSGAFGDIRLDNGKIVAVIGRVDRAVGFAHSGGNLIDLAPLPGGHDDINQVFLYLNDEFPRQAIYRELEIVSAGGGRRPARVIARGHDNRDPRIAIETEYVLEPDTSWLTLTTKFTSSATGTISQFEMGDALQWGRAEHIAPNHGFDISGKRIEADWIGAIGETSSYAFVPPGPNKVHGPNGSMWSDPIGLTADLKPGRPVHYVRHLVVGRGDTASMQQAIAKLRGDQTGRIAGNVLHRGAAVKGATVRILDAQKKLTGIARVDAAGWYAIDLIPGEYYAEAIAPGRGAAKPTVGGAIQIDPGSTESVSFDLPDESAISWRIEGDDGRAPPIKLTILGREGTADPYLGPLFRGSGARNVILSSRGVGTQPLPVGKYQVVISRGPEYELITRDVEIGEGQKIELTGRLARAIETPGFIGADLHQHAVPSFDSGVSLADRALSNAAEGVEVLVSTEHNVLTDYRPVIAAEGLGRVLNSIIGTEATTHSVGHFNAFPLIIKRDDAARGGMKDPEGLTPGEIFELIRSLQDPKVPAVIQVNHPRAGSIGYFDLMKLDPNTGIASDARFRTDVDAIEVVSFGFREETDAALRDWFSLLSRGLRITATGNSDSHTIFGRELGWPRTYVCLEDDVAPRLDEPKLIEALRNGCATISAGPFVTIRSGSARMGDLVAAPNGKVSIEVLVRAATWIPTDRLRLYVDGQIFKEVPLKSDQTERHNTRYEVTCSADCSIVALVDSDKSLVPILPPYGDRTPSPIALTNPIYVDTDGDGRFKKGE